VKRLAPTVFVVLTIGFLTIAAWERAEAQLLITLKMPSDRAIAGSKINLDVVLANASDHNVSVYKDLGSRAEFSYKIDVQSRNGWRPPETKYARDLRGEATPAPYHPVISSGGNIVLKPGEMTTDHLVLTDLFDLSQPGEYTVRVQRIFPPNRAVVTSQALTITIAPQ
jgi:hypothetical protein